MPRLRQSPFPHPSPTSPAVLEKVAYHEAGHAVAAVVQGRCVKRVSIMERWGIGGSVCLSWPPRWFCAGEDATEARRQKWVEAEIIMALAGPAANEVFGDPAEECAVRVDREYAVKLALRVAGARASKEALDKFLLPLQRRARSLVVMHWDAVDALAQALLVRHEIRGPQARRIIRQNTAAGA